MKLLRCGCTRRAASRPSTSRSVKVVATRGHTLCQQPLSFSTKVSRLPLQARLPSRPRPISLFLTHHILQVLSNAPAACASEAQHAFA